MFHVFLPRKMTNGLHTKCSFILY